MLIVGGKHKGEVHNLKGRSLLRLPVLDKDADTLVPDVIIPVASVVEFSDYEPFYCTIDTIEFAALVPFGTQTGAAFEMVKAAHDEGEFAKVPVYLGARIEDHDHMLRGIVVYQLSDGRRLPMSVRYIKESGREYMEYMLRSAGASFPDWRLQVRQNGKYIGTVPSSFEPMAIKSTNFLYEPRDGDFKREDDVWIASDSLGPDDLEAVPGFVWEAASL